MRFGDPENELLLDHEQDPESFRWPDNPRYTKFMNPYIFYRKGYFYPIDSPDDATAIHMGWLNPGTLRIERINGEKLWEPPTEIPFSEGDTEDFEMHKVTAQRKGAFKVSGSIYNGWFDYDDAVKHGLVTPSPLYKAP